MTTGRRSSWTPDDDKKLKKLADEGLTARARAERMKRTDDAIRVRSKFLNVTRR